MRDYFNLSILEYNVVENHIDCEVVYGEDRKVENMLGDFKIISKPIWNNELEQWKCVIRLKQGDYASS